MPLGFLLSLGDGVLGLLDAGNPIGSFHIGKHLERLQGILEGAQEVMV